MALIRKSELKQMNEQVILGKVSELKKELMKLNMQRATGTTLASPGKPKLFRKTIAQLLTVLHQKKNMKKLEAPAKIQPKGGTTKAA